MSDEKKPEQSQVPAGAKTIDDVLGIIHNAMQKSSPWGPPEQGKPPYLQATGVEPPAAAPAAPAPDQNALLQAYLAQQRTENQAFLAAIQARQQPAQQQQQPAHDVKVPSLRDLGYQLEDANAEKALDAALNGKLQPVVDALKAERQARVNAEMRASAFANAQRQIETTQNAVKEQMRLHRIGEHHMRSVLGHLVPGATPEAAVRAFLDAQRADYVTPPQGARPDPRNDHQGGVRAGAGPGFDTGPIALDPATAMDDIERLQNTVLRDVGLNRRPRN